MATNYKAITNIPGWLSDYTSSGLPNSTAALYSTTPILFRAIQLRADSLSAVPIKIMQGETEVDWPYPEPLKKLIWKAEASLLLCGAAYWEKVANRGGYVKDVQYRNPFDMEVQYRDQALYFRQTSTTGAWVNDLRAGLYEMVYFTDFDPSQDVLPGVGAAEVARVDSRLLAALSKFPEMFFEGGAMPVTMLGVDTSDTGEIQRVESWFKRAATSIKNAFRVLAFRAGMIKVERLTPDLNTLSMPEIYKQARQNISVAFGIPESMLDTTASNYATAKEARLGFYEDMIKSRARMFEDVINPQLLAKDKLKLEFDFGAMSLFQEDEADRAKVLQSLTGAGVPLPLAVDLAGYELTPEQLAKLNPPKPEAQPQDNTMPDAMPDEMREDMRRWERKAAKAAKAGKSASVPFESEVIPLSLAAAISGALEAVTTLEGIKAVFASVNEWRGYP